MTHIDEFTLQEYAEDALDDEQRQAVAAHLATCATCQQQVTEMHQLFAAFTALPDEPMTADLAEQVVMALPSDATKQRWGNLILMVQLLLLVVMMAVLWPMLQTAVQTMAQLLTSTLNIWQTPQLPNGRALLEQASTAIAQIQRWSPAFNLTTAQWTALFTTTLIVWLAGNRLIFTEQSSIRRRRDE